MRKCVVGGLAALALATPAVAHEPLPPPADYLFGGIVREADIDLAFDYLRESARAAFHGREAPPPDALADRAGQMADEVARRGGIAARIFIDAIEKSIREGMRDLPRQRDFPPRYPPRQGI